MHDKIIQYDNLIVCHVNILVKIDKTKVSIENGVSLRIIYLSYI